MSTIQSTLHIRTPAEMPVPQQSTAPKFKGHWSEVTDFLRQCELLFDHYNVINDDDKCRFMRSYCDRPTREIVEGLPSFIIPDWAKLKALILKIFDAERATQKFTLFDLHSFILKASALPLSTLDTFRDYMRQYMRIAGWLLGQKKIDKVEYDRCFWLGIDPNIRPAIEAKMHLRNSDLDPSTPFDFDEVVGAAEMIFKRDRFDFGVFDKPKNNRDDPSYPRDDDELTMENLKKLLKSVIPGSEPAERPPLDPVQSRVVYENLEREGEKAQKADEVESLIKQMSRLTINDPNYAVFYVRIMKLDPDVGKLLAVPAFINTPRTSTASAPIVNSTVPARPQINFSEMTCYGCMQKGHTMLRCTLLADLANQGLIVRNESGKWIMKDGRTIFRNPTESIIDAAKRLATPVVTTNLATIHVVSDTNEDDEDIAFSADTEMTPAVLAANRNEKSTRSTRKEVFDSVTVPTTDQVRAKRMADAKAEAKDKAKKAAEATQVRPNPVNPPRQFPVTTQQPPNIIPSTVNPPKPTPPPVFDPSNDDHIMEDATTPPSKPSVKNPAKKSTAPMPRASAVARHVDPFLVLNKVLNTELTLPVGELLGVSKEISSHLTDLLKVTRTVPPSVNSAADISDSITDDSTADSQSESTEAYPVLALRTQSPLIQVLISCNGKSLMAIIDSGATQSVCSQRCWRERICLPMDNKSSVKMRDVHGNISHMLGLVKNVPLSIGSVTTWTSIYVSDQVNFDLLLGCPWFRDNLVNLNERKEGTYISFHDPDDTSHIVEFLASPDAGYAEGFLSASLMSSADTPTSHLDNLEEFGPISEQPSDSALTDEDDELRERIRAQINADLTNVEWRVLQLLLAEERELEAQVETIRGLLQPIARTRFPWGHEIFQSSHSMYIGGGVLDTGHRYEDYFLFHVIRHSDAPQPNGSAFVRWFPQERTWQGLNTAPGPEDSQEGTSTLSPLISPSTPMNTPLETPSPSIIRPQNVIPSSPPIEIHVEVKTATTISPPEPHADEALSFSCSSSIEPHILLGDENSASCEDSLLPAMSSLTLEECKDIQQHSTIATPHAEAPAERCHECAKFKHSRVLCQLRPMPEMKDLRSQVIEGLVGTRLDDFPWSFPSSICPDNGSDSLEKAIHEERSLPATVALEEPLPFSDTHIPLSPISEHVELPSDLANKTVRFSEDLTMDCLAKPRTSGMESDKVDLYSDVPDRPISPTQGKLDLREGELPQLSQKEMSQVSALFYATAPASLWPEVENKENSGFDNDHMDWGVPQKEEANRYDSDWYMHADQWERMINTFTPTKEDVALWEQEYDGQDQENWDGDEMDEDKADEEEEYRMDEEGYEEDKNEEMDTGTFSTLD